MLITSEIRNGTRLLQVREDRLDAASAIQFKDRFISLLDTGVGDVVLDLSLVDFLDSSGLGAVVAVRKYLPEGVALHLAGLRPAVAKVMELTRMDRVFPIHEDAAAACAAARGGKAA